MVAGKNVTLAPSAVRTGAFTGAAFNCHEFNQAVLTLDVTAASGTTPSLTVNVQDSADGETFATVASFTAKTAVGSERKVFSGLREFIRAQAAAPSGTTPSFTWSVSGYLK
jgi:hypothetical protein